MKKEMDMTVVEKKAVPLYEIVCEECKSRIQYRKSEVTISHIRCPVCGVSNWANTTDSVAWQYAEDLCQSCKHKDKQWFEAPCCDCTIGGHTNYYETSTEETQ